MGAGAVLWAMATLAHATDTWTNVRDGVEYLHRVDPTPWDIHAVRVDLSSPAISLRASKDEYDLERHVVTSDFAEDVGALVAINGDWSDSITPVGLAIGDGWRWHEHFDDPGIGATWGVFGCDVFNGCDIQSLPRASEAWWFNPSIAPYRYLNAVGTNGLLLIDDGVALSGCYDGCAGDSCRNPRSAVCLEQDLTHLWLIAVDGRQSDSAGMTCGEMRTLALELGCWEAAMLDGGGSTTLWVDGEVVNDPSDGSQRVVANHLGIMYTPTANPACELVSGAWCNGTTVATCTGGRYIGAGDCGFFGFGCQEDGDYAFCVNPRCPGGDGTASDCLDGTLVASCTDGLYGEGDCAFFGLVCGEDAMGPAAWTPAAWRGPTAHSAPKPGRSPSAQRACTRSRFVPPPSFAMWRRRRAWIPGVRRPTTRPVTVRCGRAASPASTNSRTAPRQTWCAWTGLAACRLMRPAMSPVMGPGPGPATRPRAAGPGVLGRAKAATAPARRRPMVGCRGRVWFWVWPGGGGGRRGR